MQIYNLDDTKTWMVDRKTSIIHIREKQMMTEWKKYQRTNLAEMTPYIPGMEMGQVSISDEDYKTGSPKLGDMIARNPNNHADKWLVAAKYFQENFKEL